MPKSYDKPVVIITGGSRGLGAATAFEFAKNNYNIVLNYKQNIEKALQVKEKIEQNYKVDVMLIEADISKEENVKNLLEQVKIKFNRIDCLINNAGIAIDTTIEEKTVDNFQLIVNTNLIGTFLTCKYIGTYMKKQGFGSIINVSSTNAIDSYYPYSMDYDATKAGVLSLSHNFALLYAPNIRVNTIAPGWINTEMCKEMDEELKKEECKHILLERFAEPEEIAKAIFQIQELKYLNDSVIKIDGGRRL